VKLLCVVKHCAMTCGNGGITPYIVHLFSRRGRELLTSSIFIPLGKISVLIQLNTILVTL
jgi:hypothetical protein